MLLRVGVFSAFASQLKTKKPPSSTAASSTAAATDTKPAAKSNSFFGKKVSGLILILTQRDLVPFEDQCALSSCVVFQKTASVKGMFNKQAEKKADQEEMEDSDDGGFELRQKRRNRKKKRGGSREGWVPTELCVPCSEPE